MTAERAVLRYRLGNIPDELKALDRWVTFALEGGKPGRPTKVPYSAGTRTRAKSNDPSSWCSFERATEWAARNALYLGFAFDPAIDYTFVDLDGVIGAGGAVKAYARLIIDTLDSYTEVSVSGGAHVIVRGRPPAHFSTALIEGKIEVYPQSGGRFCLLTGDTRPGLGSLEGRIEARGQELAALFPPRPAPPPPTSARGGDGAGVLTEEEVAAMVAALAGSWTDGQRHDMGLALGGVLARNGVPEAQALALCATLSAGDANPGDRAKAVRDSYRRAANGLDLRGYQALRDLIPDEALASIDGILQRVWHAQQPHLVTPGRSALQARSEAASENVDRWPSPPPEAFHGWFGEYLDLVAETTEAPDQFHLASALTIVGAYAGRTVYTRLASGRVYPNLYTVLVGLSSESKKDTAINRAWEMVTDPAWARERTAMPFVEKNGVASAESFIKGLSSQSNVVVRMSEFSEILANARRKGTTTILTMLMKAWDNPSALSNDSIMNAATALNPYVSILAGTQPDVLASDMIGTDISSGFANRILFIPGSGKGRKPRPPEVDERALHEHWVRARTNLKRYPTDHHLEIEWTPETTELWDAFYLAPRGESAMERTLSQRHQNMVLKVALIFAMTDGAPRIGLAHLSHAITLIDWHWAQVKALATSWATGPDNRLAERIMAVLQKTGPIKRRHLQNKTKDPRWSPNDFARMIRSMTENQTLGTSDDGLIGLRDD